MSESKSEAIQFYASAGGLTAVANTLVARHGPEVARDLLLAAAATTAGLMAPREGVATWLRAYADAYEAEGPVSGAA